MSLPLSKKQFRALRSIEEFAQDHGYMPSIRELAAVLGLSAATAYQHVRALEKKGYLASNGTAHGLRFVDREQPKQESEEVIPLSRMVRVPVVGTIAAGEPIEAIEALDEPLFLPRWFAPLGSYALMVKGDSMIDDHILDGDLVVVKPQPQVERGEIAVAVLVDGTATLKRIYKDRGRIRLQPANVEMRPIYVRNIDIQGKVLAVIRRHAC